MTKDEKIIEGQGLRAYIIEALGKVDLSLDHQSKLHNVKIGSGGDFIPIDMTLALMDIRLWLAEEQFEKLIQLAKQLPTAFKGSKILYYINGKKVGRSRYFSADIIKGVRTISGTRATKEPHSDMDEDKFRRSYFAGTRLGDKKGVQLFGDNYVESEEGEEKPKEPTYPTAKTDEPVGEQEPYSDIGDDEDGGGLSEKDEFNYNEPAGKWLNRPKKEGDEDDSN